MSTGTVTLEQIRREGLKALERQLGPDGMIRFLQQFETGWGDYTKERHKWLKETSVEAPAEKIVKQRGGIEVCIRDLADMVNEATANQAGIIFSQRRKWDTKPRLLASIEKAENLVEYKPVVNFEEGFQANIEWFQDNWEKIEEAADFPPGMSIAVRGIAHG